MSKAIVSKLNDHLYIMRLNDEEVKYFEGLWRIPEGITYNAYIATLPESVVVFDGWKRGYEELFLDSLREIVDPRDVRFIVAHHLEPDHSGSIPYLLREAVNAEILVHPIARTILQSLYGIKSQVRVVQDGERISLGGGYSIRIKYTPWLHWPDTIVSYIEDERVLLTCDIFGSYGIPSTVYYEDMSEEERRKFWHYVRKYFANVIGHYVGWVAKNITKISEELREAVLIAPGHGPIYRGPEIPLGIYTKLASGIPESGKAVIVYTSMYGFAEILANDIARDVESRGLKITVFGFTDKARADESEIIGEAFDSKHIIIVTSTYENKEFPLASYISDLISLKTPPSHKRVLVIALYGWTQGASKRLIETFKSRGFTEIEAIELRGYTREEYARVVKPIIDKLLS